jgi:chromosome segregation protein
MYLSQVDIFGFKSFAKKTSINFDDGITAIVGPNGCGKTNVVDAIRWVLGEQKASILRGDKMESVIFNGAATRKPLGLAEVSLIIQNTKNILPSEYTEVEITRRLYRSGESEYLLNKQGCRLKDIINLFADTGMGADAYSVIELKMVETILSDRAEDRRHMFDEAAGVTKYKKRREAAQRRMIETERDLERVNDVVAEAERSVRSLKRQAKKSERYQTTLERVNELERNIWRWDLSRVRNRLEPLTVALQASRREQSQQEGELIRDEASLEKLQVESITKDKTLSAAIEAFNQATDKLNDVNQQKMANEHRRETLQSRIHQLEHEGESLSSKITEGDTLIRDGREKLEILTEQRQDTEAAQEEAQESLLTFYKDYNRQKSQVESAQEGLLDIIQQHSTATRTHEHHTKEFEDWENRVTRQKDESSDLELQLAEKKRQAEALQNQLGIVRQKVDAGHDTLAEHQELFSAGQQKVADTKENLVRMQSSQESRGSRLEFLQSFLRSGSGVAGGSQCLLEARDKFPGMRGVIGEMIRVDAPYQSAIEAALGDRMNYLVFNTRTEALSALEYLDQQQGGRATLIPLDVVAQLPANPPVSEGVGRSIIDLVTCDDDVRPIVNHLLHNMRLVDDCTTIPPDGHTRMVDTTGRLVDPAGFIRGGRESGEKTSYLSVTAEIDRLQDELRNGETQQAELQDSLQRTYSDLEQEKQRVQDLEAELAIFDKQLHELQTQHTVSDFDIKKDAEHLTRLYKEGEQLALFRIDNTRLEEEAVELQRLGKERDTLQQNLDTLKTDTSGLEENRRAMEQKKHEQDLRYQEVINDHRNTEQEVQRLAQLLDEYRNRIVRGREEQDTKRSELAESEGAITGLDSKCQTMIGKRSQVQTELDTLRNSQALHRDKVATLERNCRQQRDEVNKRRDSIHNLELELENLKRDRSDLEEKLGGSMQDDLPKWEEGAFDLTGSKTELQQLRDSLGQYGQINFMALEQYREETDRLEHLTKQREDILEAKDTLEQTITKINTRAREEFLATFEAIRNYFVSIYQMFFPSGNASLELEKDSDPLESKVQIFAQPQGKRFQSIALLSAGEKALTAIALLMAIYKVKPSPFCILDEVDAPLDDANVDRYLRVLREFSSETQFIIVTHNKRTMSAAKYIYGVTQQEDGVSKVVSVDFK